MEKINLKIFIKGNPAKTNVCTDKTSESLLFYDFKKEKKTCIKQPTIKPIQLKCKPLEKVSPTNMNIVEMNLTFNN